MCRHVCISLMPFRTWVFGLALMLGLSASGANAQVASINVSGSWTNTTTVAPCPATVQATATAVATYANGVLSTTRTIASSIGNQCTIVSGGQTCSWSVPSATEYVGIASLVSGFNAFSAQCLGGGPTAISASIESADSYIIVYRANGLNFTSRATRDAPSLSLLSVGVSGGGSVVSSPAGITCGNDCSERFVSGTNVSLSATPAAGYTFAGWTGNCFGKASQCTVNMLAARSVTAVFTLTSRIEPSVLSLIQGNWFNHEINDGLRSDGTIDDPKNELDGPLTVTIDSTGALVFTAVDGTFVKKPEQFVVDETVRTITIDEGDGQTNLRYDVSTDRVLGEFQKFASNGVLIPRYETWVSARVATTPTTKTVTGLTVFGSDTLQAESATSFVATAKYSDGSQGIVSATWSSSNPFIASISLNGVVTSGTVGADTALVITASLTQNGSTFTSSRPLTVTPVRGGLTGLLLKGSNSVQAGAATLLEASAMYGIARRRVMPTTWTVVPFLAGTVSSRGIFVASALEVATPVTITASYTDAAGATQEASISITVSVVPAALTRLTVVGARGALGVGESLQLSAVGVYVDDSRKVVPVTWRLTSDSGTAATISAAGQFSAGSIGGRSVTVHAKYREGEVELESEFDILIQSSSVAPKIAAEVEGSGTRRASSLSIWANSQPSATARGSGPTKSSSYKLFVAAFVPTGPLVGANPTWFVLNRSAEWGPLDSPIAEYLSGVTQGSWTLIQLFDVLDASQIAGTQIYVGYGVDDEEMLKEGRYSLVYQVP